MSLIDERRERLGLNPPPPPGLLQLMQDRHVLKAFAALMLCAGVALAVAKGVLSPTPRQIPEGEFTLAAVEGLRRADGREVHGITRRDFLAGDVTVVNVWASWCSYCREEHDDLKQFYWRKNVKFVGVTYRDRPSDTLAYLRQVGVPYDAVGVDRDGSFARRLGVRGVPVTMVLDREGRLVESFPGAMDGDRIASQLLPAIARARALPASPES